MWLTFKLLFFENFGANGHLARGGKLWVRLAGPGANNQYLATMANLYNLLDFLDDPEEANQTMLRPVNLLPLNTWATVAADDCGMNVPPSYTMLAIMTKTAQNVAFLKAAVQERHTVKVLDVVDDGGKIFSINRTENNGIYRICNVWYVFSLAKFCFGHVRLTCQQ